MKPMKLAEVSGNLKTSLELGDPPIGVKFFKFSDKLPTEIKVVDKKSRYCQFLMLARQAEAFLLTPEKLAWPAAYAAFGFGPLTEKISSGQMLHVLGLYLTKEVAANTMATMLREKANSISAIAAGLLEVFPLELDIVIVEGLPEQIMWLCLARTFEAGGRLNFNSSIFQCCCVDVTVVPYITREVNLSPGCYGTRKATDAPSEHVFMGILMLFLSQIAKLLKALSEKDIIKARGKGVYHAYRQQECRKEQGLCCYGSTF